MKTVLKHRLLTASAIALFFLGSGLAVDAQQRCDSVAFGKLIDETAQILRNLNNDSEKRFQERLRATATAKGWSESEIAAKSMSAMDDKGLAPFNTEIEQLVSQLDRLSVTPKGEVSCDRLKELRTVRDRLVAVLGQKAGFILAQVDSGAKPAAAPASAKPDTAEPSVAIVKPAAPPTPRQEARAEPTPPSSTPSTQASSAPSTQEWRPPSWSANVANVPAPKPASPPQPTPKSADLAPLPLRPSEAAKPEVLASAPQAETPLPPVGVADNGFNQQEIREASQGVFGKVTSELAGVITYAFRRFGQPNGYIIGNEGGGAFLAGLRYGDGELRTRINGVDGGPMKIYWQGPSVGVDIGATGARTLFLVYNLDDTSKLYSRFPGLDGSAYAVGGVGLTVFAQGRTIIVPISSGLGLRIGASLAYIKFTERASWNPF